MSGPAAGYGLAAAAAGLLVLLLCVLARRRAGRRPVAEAGYAVVPEPQLAALKQAARAAREEAETLRARCSGSEKLLLLLPECTRQLVNVWLPEGNIPNVATRQVKSLLDPDTVAVFLQQPDGALGVVGGFGLPAAAKPGADGAPRLVLAPGEGLPSLAAETRTLVDEATYRYQRGRELPAGRERLRLDLAAPILSQDDMLGVLAIGGSRQAPDYQRWLLTMVAELAAVAILTARSRQDIRREATTDGLTGLLNRKHLMERLAAELHRSEAYQTPLAVILFDVDNFKHYNDRNGHPAGDVCLKAVACIAREVTRGQDFVGRYGGEEFVVVALGADRDMGAKHAERVRQAICTAEIEHAEAQPLGCVSVSIGVAASPQDGRTAEALVEAADRALYRSKQAGRNRVTLAEPEYLGEEVQETLGMGGTGSPHR